MATSKVLSYTKVSIRAKALMAQQQAMRARQQAAIAQAQKIQQQEIARKKAEAEARMRAQALAEQARARQAVQQQISDAAKREAEEKNAQQAALAAKKKVVLIQWHDVQFFAYTNQIRGLKNLTISTSVETEDEEIGDEKITKAKKKKLYTASMTAYFDLRLGISDVKGEAMKLAAYGTNGQVGYMSAAGARLVPTILMIKNAKISNVVFAPDGRWISCEVQMDFVSRSKLDGTTTATPAPAPASSSGGGGGGGGGGSSGGGSSSKSSSSRTPSSSVVSVEYAKNVSSTVQKAAQKVASTVKSVVTTVVKAAPVVAKVVSVAKSVVSKVASALKKK